MIIGVMSTYNDGELIERALESLSEIVDRIVIVDGRYAEFPNHEGDFSTDGTLEIAMRYGEVYIAPPVPEPEKRNMYLRGKPGDIYFHLDADEEVISGSRESILNGMEGAEVGIVKFVNANTGVGFRRARLFRHYDGIHYDRLHYRIVDAQGNLYVSLDKAGEGYKSGLVDLTVRHNCYSRPKERKRLKSIYYQYLIEHEREIERWILKSA